MTKRVLILILSLPYILGSIGCCGVDAGKLSALKDEVATMTSEILLNQALTDKQVQRVKAQGEAVKSHIDELGGN